MERRNTLRIPSLFPLEVESGGRRWSGVLINYSSEGALLRLQEPWEGGQELSLILDEAHHWPGFATRGRVVRSSSPDGTGAFLAIRFPQV